MSRWMARKLDYFCETCNEVRAFVVQDPGSCKCPVCGRVEQTFAPLNST